MDNSDEETNGSFEFVDKVTDSSDTDKSGDEKKEPENEEDKWEDILGSGNLLKKVVKKGGDIRPERRDTAEIKYECRLGDKIIETVDNLKVSVSDCELIQGLDLIISLMYIGEVSEVKISPRFAYGTKGDENLKIPPDATLTYIIELLAVAPEPEFDTLSVEMRKEIGLRKKIRGNWWFTREEYNSAIMCYKRALDYLDYTDQDDVEKSTVRTDADTLIDERINVYNNLSVAQLKVGNSEDALTSAEIVLRLQPNNVKALFRKGKALTEKGERRDALSCFKKGLEIEPANKLILIELQKLQNLLKNDAKTERNLYKRMFRPTKEIESPSTKNTWMKLGIFVGSLAVAVVGAIIYRLNYLD